MAQDTTLTVGSPGIAMRSTQSYGGPEEMRYGEGPLSTRHRKVKVGSDTTFKMGSVVSVAYDGTMALAQRAAAGGYATGTLTFSGVGTADDNIVIGSKTYVLKAAPTTVANEVKIGANVTESAANLVAAINGAAGAGTLYGSLTTAHPEVTASSAAGVVTVVAKDAGDEANAIATTESGTGTSWGASTLASGANDVSDTPYGILGCDVSMTANVEVSLPFWYEGQFEGNSLTWHASFLGDAAKEARERAFEGSLAPGIIVQHKKFRTADIAL